MEGAPVTAATGALGPVVAKLGALLGSEYMLRRRTRKDVKFIRSKLKSMHTILWTIWGREHLDATSKELKNEALDLADDMEDAVDDFILSMEHNRSNTRFVQTKIKASPFEDLKKRANDVSELCRSKWKKKKKTARPVSTLFSRKNGSPCKPTPRDSFVCKDASELVGLDGPRDMLIEHLVGKEESTVAVEPHLKMASIVGMAGMGKTTLADLVYQAIGNKFQARAFVSVTPNPNMEEVLTSILEQVAAAAPFAGTKAVTQERLIDKISNFLKDKRYLVIIDDIWHCEEWEIIRKSLPENSLGSRLVTTTQISAMADKWRDDFDTLVYKMKPKCSSHNIWRYTIGEKDVAEGMIALNPDMVEVGFSRYGPIVKICGGLPLAHLCLFSAMTSMVREQQEQSELCVNKRVVLSAIQEQVEKDGFQSIRGFEKLVESLKVGYDDLPHHMLKTCLLYCSMYYKDEPFSRDTLVTLWVAEGFVCKEEEARGYFDELVNRGLIHLTKEYDSLITREYSLHPTMAHFLKWQSREDNFITWISDIPSSSYTRGIRRLCIDYWPGSGNAEEVGLTSIIDWSHIRSLTVFSGACYVPLKNTERLRFLNLGLSKYMEDHHLKDICRMFRLRHLFGVTGRDIRVIPPEIVRLHYLETLVVVGTSIAALPGEIGNLRHLVRLDLSGTRITKLPREIGKLHNLEVLLLRETRVTKIPRGIGGLKKLRMLDLDQGITTLPWETVQQLPHLIRVPECIRQAGRKSSDLMSSLDRAGEILSIYKNTTRSGESGGLIAGTSHMNIPHWIGDLFKDVDLLDIVICKLEEKDLKILREMPNLKLLLLRLTVVPREPVAISGEGFSRLEYLVIDSRVPRLAFQEGAMPMLFSLTLEFKFYGGTPNRDPMGIKNLGRLHSVELKWNENWYGANSCPCISAAIDVLRKEAQEHPNHMSFEVTGRQREWFSKEINEASSSRTGEIQEERRRMEEGRSSVAGEIKKESQA